MATILILKHEYDTFGEIQYLVKGLVEPWRLAGHKVQVSRGIPGAADADIVIVHADVSVVPEEYRQFAARFPAGVNRDAVDIRKRAVSRDLLQPGDNWKGQVIIKSDLNCGGIREQHHNRIAASLGRPLPYPEMEVSANYRIHDSIAAIPPAIWSDPRYVVERFLPERDEKGYWLRCWTFLGDSERCNRFCCSEPLVKGSNLIAQEPAPVPDELRSERKRLGFDYGKFDFVLHEGRAVLLDANRTPTGATTLSDYQSANASRLAQGIESLLRAGHGG